MCWRQLLGLALACWRYFLARVICVEASVGFTGVGVTSGGLPWHVGNTYLGACVTCREACVGVTCLGVYVTFVDSYVGFTCVGISR